MIFKLKLFKLGNSVASYIPKNIREGLELGKEYEAEIKIVYTDKSKVYTKRIKEYIQPIKPEIPIEENITIEPADESKKAGEFIE